jgi:hypothetical protein
VLSPPSGYRVDHPSLFGLVIVWMAFASLFHS